MVQITSSGNSVQFTFQNCPTYLNNGKIEVPKSSLALVIDESNMATFKKAASNDIFVSVSLDELDMTKDELIAYYINNMVSAGGGGGSGVTPEEVSQMIDTAIAPLEQDIDFLQDDVDDVSGNVETLSGEVQTVSGQVANKADTTALTAHTSDTTVHVTSADKANWNNKLDESALAPYWTSAQTDTAITQATSGKADTSLVETLSGEVQTVSGQVANKSDTTALTAHTSDATIHVTSADKTAWNGKQDTLVSGTNIKTVNNQSLLGSGNIEIQGGMTPAQEETIATALNELYDGVGEVSGDVGTLSGSVQTLSTTVSGIQTNLGGIKLVKLTRAQYEALTVKDTNTLYIIPDE